MPVKPIYQEIRPADIDLTDRTFALTPPGGVPEPGDATLAPSLRGLLRPPLLLPGPAGKLLVVSGREQLAGLTPDSTSGCLVLPADTLPATALELALGEILLQRPATALEQARCWSKASQWLGEAEAGRRFGSRLSLQRRYPPAQLLRLLELPAPEAAALQDGRLELTTAFRLLDLDQASRSSLFQVITGLRLSTSNQKKFLELCLDLARRREIGCNELLSLPEAQEILAAPLINPPQQATRLLTWLTELHQPRFTAAARDFQNFAAELALPAWVSLEPSPSFERDSLRLSIEFRDRAEVRKSWPALREILARLR